MRGMSPEERRAAYEALSDEDKQIVRKRQRAARDQQRAEWEAMTPEEREVRREEMRARVAKLTPEQREAAREAREKNQKARRNQSPPVMNEEAVPPEAEQP
jgi:TRAP-type C4-dicarboxylate transport system substrate-binding protein